MLLPYQMFVSSKCAQYNLPFGTRSSVSPFWFVSGRTPQQELYANQKIDGAGMWHGWFCAIHTYLFPVVQGLGPLLKPERHRKCTRKAPFWRKVRENVFIRGKGNVHVHCKAKRTTRSCLPSRMRYSCLSSCLNLPLYRPP